MGGVLGLLAGNRLEDGPLGTCLFMVGSIAKFGEDAG
jgi:hypothetical protein